jgi:hypothetical protein
LWTIKLKPSAKDSALHELVRPPQRKSAMASWIEWIIMAKESRTEDMSILSSEEMTLSDLTVHILGLYTWLADGRDRESEEWYGIGRGTMETVIDDYNTYMEL